MEISPGVTTSPHRPGTELPPKPQVRVCQNTACLKLGALAVLHAFQQADRGDLEVVATGCLGHCGQGPMVLVLPEATWYSQVRPGAVPTIATHHRPGQPVSPPLEPPPPPSQPTQQREAARPAAIAYSVLLLALAVMIGSLIWGVWIVHFR